MSSNPVELDMLRCQVPPSRLEIHAFSDTQEALELLGQREVEVFLVDEDLEDGSGLDFLHDVRDVDDYTSLVLLADENHEIDLAVEAINRARVSKVLIKPWDIDEIVDELEDAAHRYDVDVRKDRHLQLSKVRVRRLTTTIDRAQRDLADKERQLRSLQRTPTAMIVGETPRVYSTGIPAAGSEHARLQQLEQNLPKLLLDIVRANDHEGSGARVAELAESCIPLLGWSDEEREVTVRAAQLHHALKPLYPRESQIEVHGGTTRHASEMAQALGLLPSLSEVADIIANHHAPLFDRRDRTINVGRTTRLLQILSLYDEISNDEALLNSENAELDPDIGLNWASEQLLRLSGKTLLPRLCETVVKQVIPQVLGRSEGCVSVDELVVGQTLTRTVYSENLALARAGTVLSSSAIDRIRSASVSTGTTGVWVLESDAKAVTEDTEDAQDNEQDNESSIETEDTALYALDTEAGYDQDEDFDDGLDDYDDDFEASG